MTDLRVIVAFRRVPAKDSTRCTAVLQPTAAGLRLMVSIKLEISDDGSMTMTGHHQHAGPSVLGSAISALPL